MQQEYLDWFQTQWACLPDKEYMGETFMDNLISLRNNPAMKDNKELQEKLKIITFDEWKKEHQTSG